MDGRFGEFRSKCRQSASGPKADGPLWRKLPDRNARHFKSFSEAANSAVWCT